MRNINITVLVIIIFCTCTSNKKDEVKVTEFSDPCLSGFILMVYLGEINHPVYPFVLMTDEQDSTYYYRYMSDNIREHDIDKLEKYGFLMTDFPKGRSIMNATIDKKAYNTLKEYIIENNTNKDLNYWSEDDNAIRIILADQCDSITYAINKEDTNYFKNLLEITLPCGNQKLQKGLEYYKGLQEFDYEKFHKKNN